MRPSLNKEILLCESHYWQNEKVRHWMGKALSNDKSDKGLYPEYMKKNKNQ